jgi:hypothetical protein
MYGFKIMNLKNCLTIKKTNLSLCGRKDKSKEEFEMFQMLRKSGVVRNGYSFSGGWTVTLKSGKMIDILKTKSGYEIIHGQNASDDVKIPVNSNSELIDTIVELNSQFQHELQSVVY